MDNLALLRVKVHRDICKMVAVTFKHNYVIMISQGTSFHWKNTGSRTFNDIVLDRILLLDFYKIRTNCGFFSDIYAIVFFSSSFGAKGWVLFKT